MSFRLTVFNVSPSQPFTNQHLLSVEALTTERSTEILVWQPVPFDDSRIRSKLLPSDSPVDAQLFSLEQVDREALYELFRREDIGYVALGHEAVVVMSDNRKYLRAIGDEARRCSAQMYRFKEGGVVAVGDLIVFNPDTPLSPESALKLREQYYDIRGYGCFGQGQGGVSGFFDVLSNVMMPIIKGGEEAFREFLIGWKVEHDTFVVVDDGQKEYQTFLRFLLANKIRVITLDGQPWSPAP